MGISRREFRNREAELRHRRMLFCPWRISRREFRNREAGNHPALRLPKFAASVGANSGIVRRVNFHDIRFEGLCISRREFRNREAAYPFRIGGRGLGHQSARIQES